jgi:hypothetical protein
MSGPRARHSLRHKPQSTPLKFEEPVYQSAKLSANQPAQWHTEATLHTLKTPHSPVFRGKGSVLTRKRSLVQIQYRPREFSLIFKGFRQGRMAPCDEIATGGATGRHCRPGY